jgi:hypothetical protein
LRLRRYGVSEESLSEPLLFITTLSHNAQRNVQPMRV